MIIEPVHLLPEVKC